MAKVKLSRVQASALTILSQYFPADLCFLYFSEFNDCSNVDVIVFNASFNWSWTPEKLCLRCVSQPSVLHLYQVRDKHKAPAIN